jgi:hypothetical protein
VYVVCFAEPSQQSSQAAGGPASSLSSLSHSPLLACALRICKHTRPHDDDDDELIESID